MPVSVRAGRRGGARDTTIMAWVAHWYGPPGRWFGHAASWDRGETTPSGWVRYEFATQVQAQRFRAMWCSRRELV
jgi:hypothetical protein